jgi:hypothetical protein
MTKDKFHWGAMVQQVKFGNSTPFAIVGKEAIFTTSSADFLVPTSYFDSLITELIKAAG